MATLIDLPDDVLVKVLSGVDSAFELRKCSYVCKRLASVCRDDLLWRNLCEKGEERWEKLRDESENKLKEEEKGGGEEEGWWRQRNRNHDDPLPPLEYARDEVGAGEVEVEVEGGPSRDEQGGEVRDMQWRAKYRRNCQRYEAYPPTDIAGAWVGDRRYFQQERSGNAIFGQVLHLTAVCWLDIGGEHAHAPFLCVQLCWCMNAYAQACCVHVYAREVARMCPLFVCFPQVMSDQCTRECSEQSVHTWLVQGKNVHHHLFSLI
mmetsp:Transcript_40325/g.104589  ORF Transcript_40325/g.104589 Transcript_40325/m.104589 type:complete len:263 (-) Transcript_40325:4518-5306(-)